MEKMEGEIYIPRLLEEYIMLAQREMSWWLQLVFLQSSMKQCNGQNKTTWFLSLRQLKPLCAF